MYTKKFGVNKKQKKSQCKKNKKAIKGSGEQMKPLPAISQSHTILSFANIFYRRAEFI